MSGTFQLAFNGETTPVINAAATAEELRTALESLDGLMTVGVSRDYAVSEIGGSMGLGDLDLTFGSQTVSCSNGERCNSSACLLVCEGQTLSTNLDKALVTVI